MPEVTFNMDDDSYLGWKIRKSSVDQKTGEVIAPTHEELCDIIKAEVERPGKKWRVEDLRRLEKIHSVQTFTTDEEEIAVLKAKIVAAGEDTDVPPLAASALKEIAEKEIE